MNNDNSNINKLANNTLSINESASSTCRLNCVRSKIEAHDTSVEIYTSIVELLLEISGIEAAAIHLPLEVLNEQHQRLTSIAHSGTQHIPEHSASSESSPHIFYFPVLSSSKTIGSLGVYCQNILSEPTALELKQFAFYIGLVYERSSLSSQVRHYSSRLEVLDELNQLIAAGVDLNRLPKTIARECAFRFGTDCGITMLLAKSEEDLTLTGVYGCLPNSTPATISLVNTIMGRALQMGGIFSIPNLQVYSDPSVEFLLTSGISCVHCCGLSVRGELLGSIIIGYHSGTILSEHESAMFEEFARGAAIAISRAQSQDQLKHYTDELEDIVKERTADLAIQTARAEEANLAKSRFVANMSHELRTPLTAIIGYSSVIANGLYGSINDKQKDALQAIGRSSELLKELIDDVLNLSRIEAGKEEAEFSKIALPQLLQQLYKLILQIAMGKGVKLLPLEITPDVKTASLWVDSRHIRQILINLLSNAVKYTPTGGTVRLTAEIIGDKAKINVIDSGVGIAKEKLKSLFERFERGDDKYSLQQPGTGLGLSLTKHLAKINGGIIGVESTLGEGSTFWVLIPVAESSVVAKDTEEDDTETKASEIPRLDGLHLLVVDDNILTIEVLDTILTQAGAHVYTATSVAEARVLASQVDLDAALIDLAMPKENGLSLIQYFRKDCEPPLSSMPLIVVSACVFERDEKEAMAHGASHFIAKPFKPQELLSTVRHLTIASVLKATGSFKDIG